MSRDTKIGIVTAAGYTEPERYYQRLHGLLEAVKASSILTQEQKENLIIMGGESNFLLRYSSESPFLLSYLPRRSWILPDMSTWTQSAITAILDLAESSFRECVANLSLEATVLRKERAVGIIPLVPGYKFPRESLEETALVVQKKLEMSEAGKVLPFCAFNGGNDVFVDIGDKSWGVLVCQNYFGITSDVLPYDQNKHPENKEQIKASSTLHVGDQFLSVGSNDFKARAVATTAWIASPAETIELLDELRTLMITDIS